MQIAVSLSADLTHEGENNHVAALLLDQKDDQLFHLVGQCSEILGNELFMSIINLSLIPSRAT